MTSAHIFFIPGMILVGMFLGFMVGARAGRNQVDLERKRDAEREVTRAARAARREANKVDDRPPAEARSPEVVSEQKSEGKVADEKPAAKVDEAVAAKDDKPTKKIKGRAR